MPTVELSSFQKGGEMRARIFSAMLLALLLTVGEAAQADALRTDGNWWNQQNRGEKQNYMIGYMDGMVHDDGRWNLAMIVVAKKFDPVLAKYGAAVEKYMREVNKHDFGNVTVGQFIDGLDKVYADYRNRRIQVHEALIVVIRSLDGTPDDEITKLLERWRKEASE